LPRSSRKTATTPQGLVPDEDRSGPKPAFDPEAYNIVARAAKLRRIALIRSNFAVLPEYFISLNTKDAPKPRYAGEFGDYHFNAEKGQALCEWKWEISITKKRKKTLYIYVSYHLLYGGLENCDQDQVIRYMKRVGRFASYPYFRAHVSQLNWAAGVDLPPLPTIST
jgi:hypothetical protein